MRVCVQCGAARVGVGAEGGPELSAGRPVHQEGERRCLQNQEETIYTIDCGLFHTKSFILSLLMMYFIEEGVLTKNVPLIVLNNL